VNATARLEISTLAAALALGVLGDVLLRCFPWGVNFALWAGLLAAVIFFLGRERRQVFADGGWWLLLPIALSPLAFLWHDSPPLRALNLLALLTALSLAMLRACGGRLRVASLVQYAVGSLLAGLNAAFGMFPLLLRDREWANGFGWVQARKSVAVLLGLALALPPLLVFGGLFMGADAVFRSLVLHFLRDIPSHLAIIAFLTYGVGGYLRGLLFGKERNLGTAKRLLPIYLGSIETGVMLGVLDLLFLVFVAVQVRYFFGGSALVQGTTGLTYAEYARRGFFELVTVAALVLPFLLFVHWLLRPDDAPGQRVFQWVSGIQIALLFVIMASAFQRMRLYQAEYGLSEQRLYPTAFMGWLAVVFVWFCLTVLRGHRERFAFGAMVAGFLLIAALHAVDPDALIARTNLARARAGRIFDARYASRLSADAVPELVAGLPSLNPADRCTLASGLVKRWSHPDNPDWRSWTFSRSQAWQAVSSNIMALRAPCAETPQRDHK
jgi:hypothetical protein